MMDGHRARRGAMSAAAVAGSAAALIAGSAQAEGFQPRSALQALTGVYASSAPESWYGGTGTRRFSFGGGRWELTFVHALDPAMAKKTFRFRTRGPYVVGAASTTVPGAFEADFGEEAKLVTLLTDDPAVVKAFGFAGCGLKLDVEVDISATGCAGWKPVAQCGVDHDLLALGPAGLHFGVRPRDNDMCAPAKRPTALLQAVVKQ
jgi:hypothetical protein